MPQRNLPQDGGKRADNSNPIPGRSISTSTTAGVHLSSCWTSEGFDAAWSCIVHSKQLQRRICKLRLQQRADTASVAHYVTPACTGNSSRNPVPHQLPAADLRASSKRKGGARLLARPEDACCGSCRANGRAHKPRPRGAPASTSGLLRGKLFPRPKCRATQVSRLARTSVRIQQPRLARHRLRQTQCDLRAAGTYPRKVRDQSRLHCLLSGAMGGGHPKSR